MRLGSVRSGASDDQSNACRRPCCLFLRERGAGTRRDLRSRWGRRRKGLRRDGRFRSVRGSPSAGAAAGGAALLHQPGFGGPPRHRFGYGFVPLTGFGGGLDYGAPDYVKPYDQPAEAEPETTGAILTPGSAPSGFRPVMVYRPGCQTQTVTVPWEDGDDRSINIVRC